MNLVKSISTFNHIDSKVIINGHENVSAPATITSCLVLDEFIILLLEPTELNANTNIYCYDIEGKLEWIVEPIIWHERNYYTSIYVLKDLHFYGYCVNGIEAKIDFKTGKILSTELIK
jgi:hypothetical protein